MQIKAYGKQFNLIPDKRTLHSDTQICSVMFF